MSTEEIVKEVAALSNEGDRLLLEEYQEGTLEYWDGGNADDTFSLGISVGYEIALAEVMHILSVN